MLYIVLAYLVLFAALTNAVCLHNASFFAIYFCKCFLFSCFVFVYWHIVFFFFFFISIMHSAFNLFVFPNSMFTPLLLLFCFFTWKGNELSGEIALKNKHYYYYQRKWRMRIQNSAQKVTELFGHSSKQNVWHVGKFNIKWCQH